MQKLNKYSLLKVCLFIAIAIGIILRVIHLDSREFWYDEVLSLLLSTGQKKLYSHPGDVPLLLADYTTLLSLPLEQSFADIVTTLVKLIKGLVAEPHPPLFYLEQHFWLRLFGNSVAAMRSLPVIFSFGTIFCAYNLGRKLLGNRGGLLLAALLALNPFFLFHSLNVRMYCSVVFWIVLSGYATVELIVINKQQQKINNFSKHNIFWSLILVISVTAGLMTFYYFCFWLASLGIFVILQDFLENKNNQQYNILQSRKIYQQGLLLSGGVILTIPWLLWGTRQQFNNADLGRFQAGSNLLETTGKHLSGILNTLGINLLIGDWASILTPNIVNYVGIIAIIMLATSIIYLWQKKETQLLLIATCFSILPLSLIVGIDVITGKFTVGFGFGRSLILILPGCLLLLTAAMIKMQPKWQTYSTIALLLFYLTTSVADFSIRDRSMFHDLAQIIKQKPDTPTLIMLNTTAWGHVLRLAYYLPEKSPLYLLAKGSNKLNTVLTNTLTSEPKTYQRLIWLDSDRPVWGKETTATEKQAIENTLAPKFTLEQTTRLTGTWELDHFDVRIYQMTND